MAIKTQPTDADVDAFLASVPHARRREDGQRMRALMERVTGEPAVMWGPSMVGFGSEPHTNSLGTHEWPVVAFSPRSTALTIYGVYDDRDPADPLYEQLGPHTTGKGCLYLKRLDAVDLDVVERLVRQAWERAG